MEDWIIKNKEQNELINNLNQDKNNMELVNKIILIN